MYGKVCYGFDDPYMTGKVLAGISMLYPFYGERLVVEPDFEKAVLEGELHIKGYIRGIYAAIIAFHLIRDKNMRTTYRHIREFQL